MRARGLLISGRGHADAGFAMQLTRWLDQLLELPDPLFARLKARAASERVTLKQLLRGGEIPARLCTDAHLAALAIANGWRLVSFDRDFERFEGVERLSLP